MLQQTRVDTVIPYYNRWMQTCVIITINPKNNSESLADFLQSRIWLGPTLNRSTPSGKAWVTTREQRDSSKVPNLSLTNSTVNSQTTPLSSKPLSQASVATLLVQYAP